MPTPRDKTPTETALRQAIADTATAQIGKPYIWGADNPKTGFDCSGLVEYSYGVHGVSIPHNSVAQYNAGSPVAFPDIADAVFFQGSDPPPPGHEAMYIGGGWCIVAPHSGALVQKALLAALIASDKYYGARSFIDANTKGHVGSSGGSGALSGCATQTLLSLAAMGLFIVDPGLALTLQTIR